MAKPLTTPAHLIWGQRGTSDVYHPLTPPLSVPEYKGARVSLELFQSDGLTVQAFVEASDDGKTFSDRETIGSAVTSDDITISSGGTDGFLDLSSSPYDFGGKRWIRFGVQAKNSSGTMLNTGYAVLRIEGRDF